MLLKTVQILKAYIFLNLLKKSTLTHSIIVLILRMFITKEQKKSGKNFQLGGMTLLLKRQMEQFLKIKIIMNLKKRVLKNT